MDTQRPQELSSEAYDASLASADELSASEEVSEMRRIKKEATDHIDFGILRHEDLSDDEEVEHRTGSGAARRDVNLEDPGADTASSGSYCSTPQSSDGQEGGYDDFEDGDEVEGYQEVAENDRFEDSPTSRGLSRRELLQSGLGCSQTEHPTAVNRRQQRGPPEKLAAEELQSESPSGTPSPLSVDSTDSPRHDRSPVDDPEFTHTPGKVATGQQGANSPASFSGDDRGVNSSLSDRSQLRAESVGARPQRARAKELNSSVDINTLRTMYRTVGAELSGSALAGAYQSGLATALARSHASSEELSDGSNGSSSMCYPSTKGRGAKHGRSQGGVVAQGGGGAHGGMVPHGETSNMKSRSKGGSPSLKAKLGRSNTYANREGWDQAGSCCETESTTFTPATTDTTIAWEERDSTSRPPSSSASLLDETPSTVAESPDGAAPHKSSESGHRDHLDAERQDRRTSIDESKGTASPRKFEKLLEEALRGERSAGIELVEPKPRPAIRGGSGIAGRTGGRLRNLNVRASQTAFDAPRRDAEQVKSVAVETPSAGSTPASRRTATTGAEKGTSASQNPEPNASASGEAPKGGVVKRPFLKRGARNKMSSTPTSFKAPSPWLKQINPPKKRVQKPTQEDTAEAALASESLAFTSSASVPSASGARAKRDMTSKDSRSQQVCNAPRRTSLNLSARKTADVAHDDLLSSPQRSGGATDVSSHSTKETKGRTDCSVAPTSAKQLRASDASKVSAGEPPAECSGADVLDSAQRRLSALGRQREVAPSRRAEEKVAKGGGGKAESRAVGENSDRHLTSDIAAELEDDELLEKYLNPSVETEQQVSPGWREMSPDKEFLPQRRDAHRKSSGDRGDEHQGFGAPYHSGGSISENRPVDSFNRSNQVERGRSGKSNFSPPSNPADYSARKSNGYPPHEVVDEPPISDLVRRRFYNQSPAPSSPAIAAREAAAREERNNSGRRAGSARGASPRKRHTRGQGNQQGRVSGGERDSIPYEDSQPDGPPDTYNSSDPSGNESQAGWLPRHLNEDEDDCGVDSFVRAKLESLQRQAKRLAVGERRLALAINDFQQERHRAATERHRAQRRLGSEKRQAEEELDAERRRMLREKRRVEAQREQMRSSVWIQNRQNEEIKSLRERVKRLEELLEDQGRRNQSLVNRLKRQNEVLAKDNAELRDEVAVAERHRMSYMQAAAGRSFPPSPRGQTSSAASPSHRPEAAGRRKNLSDALDTRLDAYQRKGSPRLSCSRSPSKGATVGLGPRRGFIDEKLSPASPSRTAGKPAAVDSSPRRSESLSPRKEAHQKRTTPRDSSPRSQQSNSAARRLDKTESLADSPTRLGGGFVDQKPLASMNLSDWENEITGALAHGYPTDSTAEASKNSGKIETEDYDSWDESYFWPPSSRQNSRSPQADEKDHSSPLGSARSRESLAAQQDPRAASPTMADRSPTNQSAATTNVNHGRRGDYKRFGAQSGHVRGMPSLADYVLAASSKPTANSTFVGSEPPLGLADNGINRQSNRPLDSQDDPGSPEDGVTAPSRATGGPHSAPPTCSSVGNYFDRRSSVDDTSSPTFGGENCDAVASSSGMLSAGQIHDRVLRAGDKKPTSALLKENDLSALVANVPSAPNPAQSGARPAGHHQQSGFGRHTSGIPGEAKLTNLSSHNPSVDLGSASVAKGPSQQWQPHSQKWEDLSDDWKELLSFDFDGRLKLCKEVLQGLLQEPGAIVCQNRFDGRLETFYDKGNRLVEYDSGVTKATSNTGWSFVIFVNHDVKATSPDGVQLYHFHERSIMQCTTPDGRRYNTFPHGQRECIFPSGRSLIAFESGTRKEVAADGTQQDVYYADGTFKRELIAPQDM